MKKYLSLLLIILLSITFNVNADMGPPSIAKFELVVSNKNGATCYEEKDNKYVATNKKIDYNKIVYLEYKLSNDYYTVLIKNKDLMEEGCIVKVSDLSLKDSKFDVTNKEVSKIEPVNAVVLAGGGLNLRKGPSTMYSKITLVPEKTVVKLTHNSGTYWYYTQYNGNNGWGTAENGYLGLDSDYVLINIFRDTEIFSDKKMTKKVGVIPKGTEIASYVSFVKSADDFAPSYYVNYNGTKGYIGSMDVKVSGKIKLMKDTNLYDINDKVIKTLKPGTYNYSVTGDYNEYYYLSDEKGLIKTEKYEYDKDYQTVGDMTFVKKDKGYLGEGLFGEKVTKTNNDNTGNMENGDPNNLIDVNDGKTNEVKEELKKQEKLSNETIIIIALAAVILALTITVVILLVNKKKNNVVIEEKKEYIESNKEEVKEENENQFEEHNEHEE